MQERADAVQRRTGEQRDTEDNGQGRHGIDMNTPRREERRQPSRTVDLIGRVCVVTGATRGLGLATATALAGMGATVVMLGRDRARGEAAAQRVRAAAAPGADVSFVSARSGVGRVGVRGGGRHRVAPRRGSRARQQRRRAPPLARDEPRRLRDDLGREPPRPFSLHESECCRSFALLPTHASSR